jgi:hypothetical protein
MKIGAFLRSLFTCPETEELYRRLVDLGDCGLICPLCLVDKGRVMWVVIEEHGSDRKCYGPFGSVDEAWAFQEKGVAVPPLELQPPTTKRTPVPRPQRPLPSAVKGDNP